MILGMPFFLRTEPQIRWRERAFVVLDGNTTHVLRADMLTPAETEAAAALDYVVWDAKRMLADVMAPPRSSSPTTVSTTGAGSYPAGGVPTEWGGGVLRAAAGAGAYDGLEVVPHAGAEV